MSKEPIKYYLSDADGNYIGEAETVRDPMKSLRLGEDCYGDLADGTIAVPPPAYDVTTQYCRWNGEMWVLTGKPIPVDDVPKTDAERWADQLEMFSGMDADGIKRALYSSQKMRFIGDRMQDGLSDVPLVSIDGMPMSVDGLTKYYMEHLGDEGHMMSYADFTAMKSEAKKYIRNAVDAFKGV